MEAAQRVYIPSAMEACGRLQDAAALGMIRQQLRVGSRDRVVPAGSIALARLRGAQSGDEVLALWSRAGDRAEYAGLATALGIAGPRGAEKELLRIARAAPPRERAFALGALAAMATPDEAVDRRIRDAFFVYDAPRTVTRLARFGDSFFLAPTDE